MKSAQILGDRINTGQLTLGVIASFHFWVDLVEICRRAGLDYLIIDLEHGLFSEERVVEACALGRMIDFPILLRPCETEFSLLRRMADAGPCGFLLPMVESAAMLDETRDALYMPPRGRRRPGGLGNRWVTDVQYETWRTQVEDDFIVLPQIENRTGLLNAHEIAGHEITTATAVGPYDLSANLGVCWQPEQPDLVAALEQIREAGKAAGKNSWMIGDATTLVRKGYSFICLGDPACILEAHLKQSVATLRTSLPPDCDGG